MGRRRRRGGPHGVLIIDKPVGPTSFTVLRSAQRAVGASRAGHAGTLDPAASGVMVALFGEATKLSPWLIADDKVYRARVLFGVATDTLDREGAVVETREIVAGMVTEAAVASALETFIGTHPQRPPRYSALKKDGRSHMSRARAGEVFEVEERPATCTEATLLGVGVDWADIELHVHKGFYVRSFARDLGVRLGLPAHLGALRRTQSGHHHIEHAHALDGLDASAIIPVDKAVPDVATVVLDAAQSEGLRHGRAQPAADVSDGERAIAVSPDGVAVAMVEVVSGAWTVVRGFRFEDPPPPASDA